MARATVSLKEGYANDLAALAAPSTAKPSIGLACLVIDVVLMEEVSGSLVLNPAVSIKNVDHARHHIGLCAPVEVIDGMIRTTKDLGHPRKFFDRKLVDLIGWEKWRLKGMKRRGLVGSVTGRVSVDHENPLGRRLAETLAGK